ncbi:MAG: hypothetical protein CMB48_01700 [Euryarchaeota archaeon]|nr:hypothetical protein [Euryarchaeota archaeon]
MAGDVSVEFWVATIPFVPLLTFPIILFLGQYFNGKDWWKNILKEGGAISLMSMGVVLILTSMVVAQFIGEMHHGQGKDILDWITFDVLRSDGMTQGVNLGFGIYIDHISLMLLFVASFLCFLINWFSIGYMNTDKINDNRNHRFYAEFLIFCSGMLGMVLADNFLWLFIFWEIMGLCSYLLIGFYYEKPSAAAAAKKAFLTTRVGDVFLMIGLIIMWNIYGSLEFDVIFGWNYFTNPVDMTLLKTALILMFIGAVGKSAQFPLHVWLPDAMEGPTPVSALIHAATMVNAGLYLVARMFPIFTGTADSNLIGDLADVGIIIAMIGGITAFMAAGIAFVQNDIKKVLAYSTMSQLAYIFTGLGASLWFASKGNSELALFALGASLFHLFNHAMAKGMLFMASGSVIHEMHHAHHHISHGEHEGFDAQDMTNMGGLASKLPITSTAMAAGSMSIIGIPLIGGFWSKEGIIAKVWKAAIYDGGYLLFIPAILLLISAGMTGFYMSRMWFMTFAGKPKTKVAEHVHEETPWIKFPLVILTFMTLGGIVFASLHFVNWVSTGHALHYDLVYEMKHAFLAMDKEGVIDSTFLILTWATIGLSSLIGPVIAMSLYGGNLKDGEKAIPTVSWLVKLSGMVRNRWQFNNKPLAESGLAEALRRRLYFDDLYDWFCLKIIVPIGLGAALFDKKGIDGVIKGIESGSQSTSTWIRKLTTGSARDYIMMVALGSLLLVGLIWGMV